MNKTPSSIHEFRPPSHRNLPHWRGRGPKGRCLRPISTMCLQICMTVLLLATSLARLSEPAQPARLCAPSSMALTRMCTATSAYQDGKLVLEEYFYGYNAQRPHQLRSTTKSVVSALAGSRLIAVPLRSERTSDAGDELLQLRQPRPTENGDHSRRFPLHELRAGLR